MSSPVTSFWDAFSRRAFLSSTVATAGAPLLSFNRTKGTAGVAIPHAPFRLISPKDAFILRTSVTSGALIKVGDPVCQLDTDLEDRALDRVELAQALLSLEDAKLTPEMIAERRKIVEMANTTAQSYRQFAANKAISLARGYEFGPVSVDVLSQAEAAAVKATCELKKTELALARFDFAVKQLQQRQQLLRDQLNNEHKRIVADRARLTINAPTAGTIALYVATTCFVKQGDMIAEVYE